MEKLNIQEPPDYCEYATGPCDQVFDLHNSIIYNNFRWITFNRKELWIRYLSGKLLQLQRLL